MNDLEQIVHDTLGWESTVNATASQVWAAYADPTRRVQWAVPAGEAMVYDQAEFAAGGRDRYRCGPPDSLDFSGVVDYVAIQPHALIVYAESVAAQGNPLLSALVTWRLAERSAQTHLSVTVQATSFARTGMFDGMRNGYEKTLSQLSTLLGKEREG